MMTGSTDEWETEEILPKECPEVVKDLFTNWINDGKSGPEEESIVCFLQTQIEEDQQGGWAEPIGEDSGEELEKKSEEARQILVGNEGKGQQIENGLGEREAAKSTSPIVGAFNFAKSDEELAMDGDLKEDGEEKFPSTFGFLLTPRTRSKIKERKEKRKTWWREKDGEEEKQKKREIKKKRREDKEKEKQQKKEEKKQEKEKKRIEKKEKKEEKLRKKLESSQKRKTRERKPEKEK